MADRPASERTEEATIERLRKAREEGQIPQTQEVPSALLIGALVIALGVGGEAMMRWLTAQVTDGLTIRPPDQIGPGGLARAMVAKAGSAMVISMPFLLAAAIASVASGLLGSGWAFSPKALRLRFDRLGPQQAIQQMFSSRSVVTMLISLVKLTVLSIVVYVYLKNKSAACMALRWGSAEQIVAGMARLVFGLMVRVAVAVTVIAGADFLYQRWKYRKDLRMTRQEVKEERKQYELAPELRGRIRGIQIEMARKRMLQEVPKADVVLANPTHVAVALKYDSAHMEAPRLLAKGGDFMCEKIKEIARAHGVPILHRPELARALYAACEVGQPIPDALFLAVAEVLAMIYRLRRQRAGN
jgi:flagellar biosynthetic protein FlhB